VAPSEAVPRAARDVSSGAVVPAESGGVGLAATPELGLPGDAPSLAVSLTFDDSYAVQLEAAAILEAHGLRGTFYVNSPRLHDGSANPGTSEFMSVAGALALQARGHELGGHTLSHPSLTQLPEAERVREVLADRAQLLALGLMARSFAYPRGDVEDDPGPGRTVLEIARGSGYSSARDTNGFRLDGCDPGPERAPPRDPFLLRSVRSVNDAPPAQGDEPAPPPDTAATLLGWMDHAASCGGGAWLPLIFHQLRDDCASAEAPGGYCFDFAELEQLAAALASGARCPEGAPCYRIEVAPVSDVLGSNEPSPAIAAFALGNASLEQALASGSPQCFQLTQGDGGTAVFERSELAHGGLASQHISIAEPFVAPAEVRVARDLGVCAPFTTPGRAYELSLFYRADPAGPVPELRVLTYRLTSDYSWEQWESSEPFLAQTPGEWVEQRWHTAAVPDGTLAFSFGLRLQSVGAVAVDDFGGAPLGVGEPAAAAP